MDLVNRGLLALLALLSTGIAFAASDWRYAGVLRNGARDAPQFFDAQSIGYPTSNTTRVWVKVIRASDLETYYRAHEKWVTDEVTRKIATGHVPNFLLLPAARTAFTEQAGRRVLGSIPTTFDEAVTELTRYEVIANTVDIRAVSKLWVEIDCAGKRFRTLNPILFGDGSDTASQGTQSRGDYQFIPPNTGPDWLSLLTCPST